MSEEKLENVEVATLDVNLLEELVTTYNSDVTMKVNGRNIEIVTTASEDGYLYVPVNYENNSWTAVVNGKEAAVERYMEGYLLVKVEKGVNNVVLTFTPMYMKVGILLTCITFVLVAVLFVFQGCDFMSKKFETFRVCPGCGQLISTSRSICDCGYILKRSKFRITGSVDAQFLSVIFFVFLLLCWFNSIGTEIDLENATYEIESLNHTISNLEDELAFLQNDYDDLLYKHESLSKDYDTGYENGYEIGYSDGYYDGYNTGYEDGYLKAIFPNSPRAQSLPMPNLLD